MAGAPANLRNETYTDRELLFVIHEEANSDGWAATQDIADTLGFRSNGKRNGSSRSPAGRVSPRLSWMVRYGFLEAHPDQTDLWKISSIGHDLRQGKLSKGLENALAKLAPGEALLVMRSVTQSGFVNAPVAVAHAVRREYLHQSAQRKR